MRVFYFNTGVKPANIFNPPFPYEYHKKVGNVIKDGVLQTPFECEDVPEGETFMFACDNPALSESKATNVIVREIHNSNLVSKYAYFRINK